MSVDHDPVNHPSHYTQRGVECIEITRHCSFNLGNAIKYLWRAGDKGDAVQDLRKAIFYLRDERGRLADRTGFPVPAPSVDLKPVADTLPFDLRVAFLLIWDVSFLGMEPRALDLAIRYIEAEIERLTPPEK